jgi:phosphoglycolate phosphatase-like HAD superfamily hydrolase
MAVVSLASGKMVLLLFDVDGTLIHCGRQVRAIIGDALRMVYGESGDLDGYDFSGKTDDQIVFDLLSAAGLPEARIRSGLEEMRTLYFTSLKTRLRPEEMRVLPNVRDLLCRLAEDENVALGLITGNWEKGARIKLESVGLEGFFSCGAFGDGSRSRRELPPKALRAAGRSYGRSFVEEDAVILGDSPLDVDCARAHGIRMVAVSTGWTSEEALKAAGADCVLPDLSTVHVRRALPELGL